MIACAPSLRGTRNYDRIPMEATVTESHDESSEAVTPEIEGLVEDRVITDQIVEFLKACMVAKLNLAISGPSNTGKRKLLYALLSLLPGDEQILAIQNPDEPSLAGKGITTLRANLSPGDGKHIIGRHYLLSLVPKLHPQRLLLDGVQGSEALPLVRLLFTMDGIMFSIVADSPRDALSSLERMLLLSKSGMQTNMVRRVLSTSLDLIIQLQRLPDGSARIVNVTEVAEAEDDTIALRDIFLHQEIEKKKDRSLGLLRPTGIKPHFADRMEMLGIPLPAEWMFNSPPKKKRAAS